MTAPSTARTPTLWLVWNVALAGAAAWVVATTVIATLALVHPLPFQDQWAFLADYRDWRAGDYGLGRLWAQHNEHRIPFARLFFFADLHWFGGQNRFLAVATLATQAVHATVTIALACAAIARPRGRLAAASLVLLALGSALQINCFVWGFCIQYALAFATPTLAFAALAVARRVGGPARAAAIATAVLLAMVAAGSIASGLVVWPLLLSLAAGLGLGRRTVAALAVAGLGFVVAYLVGYHSEHSIVADALAHPRHLLLFPLCLLGNPLAKIGPPAAAALGALAAVLGTVLVTTTLRRLRRGERVGGAELALLHAMVFFGLSALAVGVGRAHDPVNRALSSRYTMIGLALWATLLALLWARVTAPGTRAARWQPLLAILSTALAAALVGQQHDAATQFEPRLTHERLATAALLTGVDDPAVFEDLLPSWAPPLVPVLQQADRSIFAGRRDEWVGEPLASHFAAAPPIAGDTSEVEALPGGDGWRVQGWLATGTSPTDRLVLGRPDGDIAGFAVTTGRDEQGRTTWAGYVRSGPSEPLAAYLVTEEGAAAPLMKVPSSRDVGAHKR